MNFNEMAVSEKLSERVRKAPPVARAVRLVGRGVMGLGGRLEELGLDHRAAVGGRWEEIGELQLRFLRDRGLEPQHRFLDIGCGSLRGGVRFVSYLDRGHYFGIDISAPLIERGRRELAAAGLDDRDAQLLVDDSFSFERFGSEFDFAIAQSVFTHLPLNSIYRCLVNASRVLRPGGRLYATIFEQESERHDLAPFDWHTQDGRTLTTWPDRDPFHYRPEILAELCEGLPLSFRYIGDWAHPRCQRMLEFTRVES